MRILGIDPGAKPGYAIVDTSQSRPRKYALRPFGRVAHVGRELPDVRVDRAVCELQWLRPGVNPHGILTLAFRAGWQLRGATAEEYHAVEVTRQGGRGRMPWKSAVFRSGEKLSKAVFCNRIYNALHPDEKALVDALPKGAFQDACDAIGIAWASEAGVQARVFEV